MNCPRCAAPVTLSTAKFCEDCGAPLSGEPPVAVSCANCGAGADAIDEAGYCTQCGLARHRATGHDHWEVTISPHLGGVCDLGLKRVDNEDFFALAEEQGARVAVVCDGVSQSRDADQAAAAAAPIVCQALLRAVSAPAPNDLEAAMREALGRAHAAVAALAQSDPVAADAPASTIVAALVQKQEAVLGWLGDCRAYWITSTEARLLTKDHSWVNEVVDAGTLSYAEALTRKGAHAVTRSLGGPALDGTGGQAGDEPSLLRVTLSGPGWLLLCSDGLWGYAPEPAELAIWLREAASETDDATAIARALVQRGRQGGGRDNLTAALIHL